MSRFDGIHFQPSADESWSAAWCALRGGEMRSDGHARGDALFAPQYLVSGNSEASPLVNDALLQVVREAPYFRTVARYRRDGISLEPVQAPPAYVSAQKLRAAQDRARSPHGDPVFLVWAQHISELDAGYFFIGKSSSLTYTVGHVRSKVGPVAEGRAARADADDTAAALEEDEAGGASEAAGASWLAGIRVESSGASSATFYDLLPDNAARASSSLSCRVNIAGAVAPCARGGGRPLEAPAERHC